LYATSSFPDAFLHRLHFDLRHLHESLHFPVDRLSNDSRQFGVTLHGLSHWIAHVGDHSTESRTFDRHFHRKRFVELRRFNSMDVEVILGLQNTGVAIFFLRLSLPQPDSDLAIVVPIFVSSECRDALSRWPLPFLFLC
jgi:hypothetical protein